MNKGEREALAGLLPFEAEPRLPDGRRRLLKEFVMSEIRRSAGHPRRRPLRPALLASALALGVAAAVGVPVLLGSGTPAYAVSRNPDGTLTITINEAKDPEPLEATLRSMGVNAVVDYIPSGKRCSPQPRSTSFLSREEAEHPADGRPFLIWPPDTDEPAFRIDPAAVKPGQTAVLEFSVSDDGKNRAAGVWANISNGPVAPCTLVDSDEAPLGPPPGWDD
ncbi:hypothetical protein GCM10010116_61000 [Microbispora rosea subsp. aerata]|nr:hypothetical protein [Microbispora rosea]GGO30459.1 hypothetical protein GCM10010116_61000 [Microbispora rosea subsp. aerata]GIH59113.1 hypothetical protein Mro02_60270 [Microbispora rosea subsp. aerata]GLJ86868.1 hypothetical protein GCM10017588_56100 [Microbispora rosea subsp. aerata]